MFKEILIMKNQDYKYGFNDGEINLVKLNKGLNEDIIRKISEFKNEDRTLMNFRLSSYDKFLKINNPK